MAGKLFSLTAPCFLLSKLLPKRSHQYVSSATNSKFQKLNSLLHNTSPDFSNKTLVFHLETALLKSSSLFPYFMLVAFEAGGLLRALVLFFLYPLLCLVGRNQALKIMVFVSFVGVRKDKFRIGSSVLPKYFLEDVGNESFSLVMSGKRKVAVSDMPRIMVEGFLKHYLGVDAVRGRELKVVSGYFVGLMAANNVNGVVLDDDKMVSDQAVGIGCFSKYSLDHQLFSYCKEIYLVSEADKWNWQILPREKYPKPLIFHDGRLAFRPTPLASRIMFMWLPLGIFIFIIRYIGSTILPIQISHAVNSSTGAKTTISKPKESITKNDTKTGGVLYICNHRTLLDPIFVSYSVMKPVPAVTYSISRFSEVSSPIKIVRLTRDREKDKKLIEQQLCQGDLVVCPEGTTCREPYLLRFSPLFAEMTDEIVPIAIDIQVNMFYGSTASRIKCLDPVFNLLNPFIQCSVKILGKIPSSQTCKAGGKPRIEVANHVQKEIAKALGFESTILTRKDKYKILAGNEGKV
ncbi:hypothetical protein Dsin_002673 [Dipteronia sinensis]|uniref:Phospholipid/glycerol acyltransferase domain-containing protein n=1 Tax=Dipteronia sinensis TaxID=43782 RepID=A0AAE0B6J9_9ROSI|nr:hypothetical protein Dsin_002673 [Dipteronia sinensis]